LFTNERNGEGAEDTTQYRSAKARYPELQREECVLRGRTVTLC
jgi:hypothetical protein